VPATTPSDPTADALFASANRERIRGNAGGAIALYERLRAEFPRSTEAAACNVTLGVLYLQLGQAERALGAFRRSPATAEALWGQAQALRQLGRPQEERLVLEDIVRRHGGSAYAPAAQKRLAELN
jgi:tetratricopeptide (TPR) repeat protein